MQIIYMRTQAVEEVATRIYDGRNSPHFLHLSYLGFKGLYRRTVWTLIYGNDTPREFTVKIDMRYQCWPDPPVAIRDFWITHALLRCPSSSQVKAIAVTETGKVNESVGPNLERRLLFAPSGHLGDES